MKRATLIVVGIILISNTIFSQGKLEFGLGLKPQYTNTIRTAPMIKSSTVYRQGRMSLSYGLLLGYRLNNLISFNSGMFYNPQGIKKEKLDGDYGVRFLEMKYNYIRIPIYVKFCLPNKSPLQLTLSSGLGINYLINVQDNISRVINFVDCIPYPIEERYKKLMLDYSLSFGINYQFAHKVSLMTDFEGIVGLNRVDKNKGCWSVNSKIFNIGINVGVKYSIF